MNAILTESYDNNISGHMGISVNGCMHMNELGKLWNSTRQITGLFLVIHLLVGGATTDTIPFTMLLILIGQTEFVVDTGVEG